MIWPLRLRARSSMRLDLRRFALHSAVSTAVVALGTACGGSAESESETVSSG